MTALTMENKNSIFVKLMGKFGYRHVPDKMVQVIERNGRYHRAVDKTFVRRNPFIESFGPQIRVGVRVVENLYENIISRDGVPHSIKVCVKIIFDLQNADPKIAPLLVQNGERLLNGKISALVDLTIRRKVSHLYASELLSPDLPIQLEEAIEKRLADNLGRFGASLFPADDGLVVKEILSPPRMRENRTEATNIEETTNNLANLSPEEIRRAVIAHMFRDMGTKKLQVRAMSLPNDLNPVSKTMLDDPFQEVLRQPTGRIYDN